MIDHELRFDGVVAKKSQSMRNAVCCALVLAFTVTADQLNYSIARVTMLDDVNFYAALARAISVS